MRRWMEEWQVKEYARRGSTLGWTVMVMTVVMILLMSALAMSSSHICRYQRYHNRRQIQMTAISVVKAIAGELEHPSGEGGLWDIMELVLEESEEGEAVLGGLDEEVGDAYLGYCYNGERPVLEVQVQEGNKAGQTKVTMRRGSSRGDMVAWEMLGFGAEEMEQNNDGSWEDGEPAAE